MLVFGPDDLREEIATEFQRLGVAHEHLVLASHSAVTGNSVNALTVAVGEATARAAKALADWFVRQKGRRRLSVTLFDGTGNRRQIVVESPDMVDIPLLLAQAREVGVEKKPRASAKRVRAKLPTVLRNALLDEARSTCPSCGVHGVSKLEAHHIDGDRSCTVADNLIMLCGTCHGQADKQLINRELVFQWKQLLLQKHHPFLDAPRPSPASPEAPVVNGDNYGQAAKTINNTFRGVKPARTLPTPGTIEADPVARTYVHYLVRRYTDWRLKGIKEMGDDRPFNPGGVWNVIQNQLGFAPYKADLEALPTVIELVTGMIDRTPFGCRNRSKNIRNYHTLEEHRERMRRRKRSRP